MSLSELVSNIIGVAHGFDCPLDRYIFENPRGDKGVALILKVGVQLGINNLAVGLKYNIFNHAAAPAVKRCDIHTVTPATPWRSV